MLVELLDKKHNRQTFQSSSQELTDYFHRYAMQDQKRLLSHCFVLADEDRILGYYTLSANSVDIALLQPIFSKRKLGSYRWIPVFLLGRLAIDVSVLGQGYGKFLLQDALRRSFQNDIRPFGLLAEAKDEKALQFYLSQGFKYLEDNKVMFSFTDML